MEGFYEIPEFDYKKLVELMGKHEADDYIRKQRGNYRAVVFKIYRLELRREIKARPIRSGMIAIIIIWFLAYLFWKFITY